MEDILKGCGVRAETPNELDQRLMREMREKQAAAQYGDTCRTASPAHPHDFSLREQAEKQVGYHREQADRQDRAAAFFRENPAFDEFVQLIRRGVIQF